MTKKVAERLSRRRHQDLTTPGNPSPANEGDETIDLAEWIRLPKPGERCPRTGLTRSSLNDLIFANPPKVRSVVLKKPGASRGIRILHWASVRRFLLDLMEEQVATATDHREEVGDE